MVNLHDDVNGVLKPSQYWGRPNSMSATAAAIAGALVLLSAAVLHSVVALEGKYGSQPNPMGFHEGGRRIVSCDGGHITGFDAYVSHLGGFAEPTLNALRLICSSGRIQVEYEQGSFADTAVFGLLPPDVAGLVKPIRVQCPPGTAVAAIDWRRVPGTEKDNTARIAGFAVHCGTESHPKPIVVDSKPGQQYPASLKCSGTANAPTGRALALTTIEIWHEQLLTGLHMISCQAARQ